MNDPRDASPAPGSPSATAPTQEAPAGVGGGEEPTAPHRLRKLAVKLATQRRRTWAASLVVKRPRLAEVRVPLERGETVIGRDPRCDIVLQDESVSRRHACIRRNDGGYFEIEDLGSRNGVLVDDERVDRMVLIDGDTFIVGDTSFQITVGTLVGTVAAPEE